MGCVDPNGCREAKGALKAGKSGRQGGLRGIQWRQEVGARKEASPRDGDRQPAVDAYTSGSWARVVPFTSKERRRAALLVAQWERLHRPVQGSE